MDIDFDHNLIAGFVRNTLGCGCPEEVFNNIEVSSKERIGTTTELIRVNIGNTLLIYIVREVLDDDYEKNIRQLLLAGKSDRDGNNFNRFRLVVAGGQAVDKTEKIKEVFSSIAGADEKLYLHFVETKSLKMAFST